MSRQNATGPHPTFNEDKVDVIDLKDIILRSSAIIVAVMECRLVAKFSCTCGQPWSRSELMLQCRRCRSWYHLSCIKVDYGPHMLCSMDYSYECAQCSPKGQQSFERQKPTYRSIVFTALYNLHQENRSTSQTHFSISKDIIPYISHNIEKLMYTKIGTERDGWQTICKRALATDHLYLDRCGEDGVALNIHNEPWLLIPDQHNKSFKRSAPETNKTNKKPKSTLQDPATVSVPSTKLSSGDRAEQLRLAHDSLTITGYKGYAMARATQGVARGHWYYEVELGIGNTENDTQKETRQPHWRIGWAQRHGALQAPCGFDVFSYSWRDRDGHKFHNSRGAPYSQGGYGKGDVLGFEIILPQHVTSRLLPIQTHGTHVPVVVQGNTFVAEKQKTPSSKHLLTAIPGSKIICYKNGECQGVMFENINSGTYYPAISLYNHAKVISNFGPNFKYPPPDSDCKPICHAMFDTHASLALAECLARVLNATDIITQRKQISDFLQSKQKEQNDDPSLPSFPAPENVQDPPPYHPQMKPSLRKKYRQFLMKQPVCVREEAFDNFPARYKPVRMPDAHYI
eukprot:gene10685-2784_t